MSMSFLSYLYLDKLNVFANPCFIFSATVVVVVFSFIAALTSDTLTLFITSISFFIGALGCHFLLRSRDLSVYTIPNLMEWKRQPLPGLKHSRRCGVCGNRKCKRHRPELSVQVLKPWTGFMVPSEIDQLLEEMFSLTFQEYILSWYNALISHDEAFLQEIKISLRYMLATLVKRVLQVDLVTQITGSITKTLLQHADAYIGAGRTVHSDNETIILRQLSPTLHRAMKSRKAELSYLHGLTERLLPYLLPHKSLQSRSAISLVREIFCSTVILPIMDIIADPNIINELLILFFDKTPMVYYPESTTPKVELLRNFDTSASNRSINENVLQTDLQTILSHQQLLFPFMQFLKEEAAVNVLQFCLGVDDFNKRILNPDLTQDQLISLHKDINEMYCTYFAYGAVDRINFEDDIVQEMRKVAESEPANVILLRTTTTLFRAYDHAYSQLEDIYCPLFHQSSRYFSLLCGDRLNNTGNRSLWRGRKGPEQSTMSKIGHRIKGVFVPTIDNGRMYEEETAFELGEAVFDGQADDDIYRNDDSHLKDLSAWRVSIPRVETLMDLNCKYYDAFVIDVQRIDVRDDERPEEMHWTVHRRYNEFYVLSAKLSEFHGEILDVGHLPPKRSFSNKGLQFLESRRPIFEKYLSDLLAVPSLRRSELLYKFLKSAVEFASNFLPEINLGKMFKTVPMKLMKEKGQNLLPFLRSFTLSTEAEKPKPSKMDSTDICDQPTPAFIVKLTKTIYKDNCSDVVYSSEATSPVTSRAPLNGIYDYLVYLAANVYKLNEWYLRLFLTFEVPLRQILQAYVEWYLDGKLRQALHPIRLTALLENLRDILFFSEKLPTSDEQKQLNRNKALEAAKEFFPEWLSKFIGKDKFNAGTDLLFGILQNPRLNKQLSYRLLDLVVLEVFPELRDDTPSPP